MKKHIIKYKNSKLAEVFFLNKFKYPVPVTVKDRLDFVESLINSAPKFCSIFVQEATESINLGQIYRWIFGNLKRNQKLPPFKFDKKAQLKQLKEVLISCVRAIPQNYTFVFFFPRFDSKNPAAGCCFSPDTFELFVNHNNPVWKTKFQEVFSHEYFHSKHKGFIHKSKITVMDRIIREGLAVNFSEYITGKLTDYGRNLIGPGGLIKYLKKFETQLNSTKFADWQKILKYGFKIKFTFTYQIGYELAKRYLDDHPNLLWEEIIKIPEREIASDALQSIIVDLEKRSK